MILELLSLRLNLNWSVAEATFGDRHAGTSLLFPPHRAARWQQKALILQIARKKLSLRLRSRTNSSLQSLFLLFSGGWERREGKNRWKRRENCARRRCQFRPTCVSWYFADVEKFFFLKFRFTLNRVLRYNQRWKFCYEFVGDGRKKQPARERFIQLRRSAAQHLTQERNNVKLEILFDLISVRSARVCRQLDPRVNNEAIANDKLM